MGLHKNAGLTVNQRKQIKALYEAGGVSYKKLADRFGVTIKTIEKWVKRSSPEDFKSGPKRSRSVITPEYRAAIIQYRKANPFHGPIRIAEAIKEDFGFAKRGTVLTVLQQEGLTRPKREKKASQ